MTPLLRHDRRWAAGHPWLAGVDEAGRGALAGPVCAGAVAVTPEFLHGAWVRDNGPKVDDSKRLPEIDREALGAGLRALPPGSGCRGAIGWASEDEIARFNILGATRLAMARALENLAASSSAPHGLVLPLAVSASGTGPDLWTTTGPSAGCVGPTPTPSGRILVDGLPLRPFPYAHEALVGGDARSFVIACASILAKTARDARMRELDHIYIGYELAAHKGYGTPAHWAALRRQGPSPCHRLGFLRALPTPPRQTELTY